MTPRTGAGSRCRAFAWPAVDDVSGRTDRALPATDRDTAAFWGGVRDRRLTVQRCADCATLRFPPRPICATCHSWETTWTAVAGTGRVLSWAVTHQRFVPQFPDVPYTVLLVELSEQPGLAMYGRFDGDPAPLVVGTPVTARFEDVSDEVSLVQWDVADAQV